MYEQCISVVSYNALTVYCGPVCDSQSMNVCEPKHAKARVSGPDANTVIADTPAALPACSCAVLSRFCLRARHDWRILPLRM